MKIEEKDFKNLYGSNKNSKWEKFLKYFLWVVYTMASVLIIFTLVNFNTFLKKFNFWYQENISNQEADNSPLINPDRPRNSTDDIINVPVVSNNSIVIEKINVDIPIIWNTQNIPSEVESNLKNGVIHLKGTALPGEKGNVFITGHSSDYFWSTGNYKEAFVLLDKLVIGDRVYVNFNDVVFGYKVVEIKIVKPSEISVLDQEDNHELTLMTCTPVGTAFNRLIIIAEEFYKR